MSTTNTGAVADTGAITEWPQSLVWAAFDTQDGAANAQESLRQAHQDWLIWLDNAAVIEKNKDGGVEFTESADRSGTTGMSRGALIGGIVGMLFPPALLASAAAGAAAGGLGAKARDTGFEDNALRAAANDLAPGSSLLIAVMTHQWVDDAVRALDRMAYKVGRTEITQQIADAVQSANRAA